MCSPETSWISRRGFYPQGRTLDRVIEGDRRIGFSRSRRELMHVALEQSSLSDAAAVILIAAVYERTTAKYSTRGIRYLHMEVGHAAQNVYLQAIALELRTVAIGAFDAGMNMNNRSTSSYWKGITTEVRSTKPPIAILTRQKGSTANVRLASSTA
jgi:Nitroreductase family